MVLPVPLRPSTARIIGRPEIFTPASDTQNDSCGMVWASPQKSGLTLVLSSAYGVMGLLAGADGEVVLQVVHDLRVHLVDAVRKVVAALVHVAALIQTGPVGAGGAVPGDLSPKRVA